MSVRIFRDVEEALSREVRRITFNQFRTKDNVVLQDVFDPFTGDIISINIEPSFYDSSADTNHIQYPHFFIRLLKTREDRFTNRIVPEWDNKQFYPVDGSPGAYEIIMSNADGIISAPGNLITTSAFTIRKIQVGFLIRLLNGNNKGTYVVSSIVPNSSGPHSIFVSSTLVSALPSAYFDATSRILTFTTPVDLNTVAAGDIFHDASAATFAITGVNTNPGGYSSLTLGGVTTPSTNVGGSISRTGNIFKNADLMVVNYLILDPSMPVQIATPDTAPLNSTGQVSGFSPKVPLDLYYLVRIDSKERETHVEIINRVWEEFNPPRTALPIIERSALSAEQLLTANANGTTSITVADNTKFNINDPVFIFDDFTPTKSTDETFQRPFESVVAGKASVTNPNDTLILKNSVPNTFLKTNNAKVVSNCDFRLWMFHFVDHVTKDVEGAQYWVHEFTFWVQIWVDRLETIQPVGTITDIETEIDDFQGNVLVGDS